MNASIRDKLLLVVALAPTIVAMDANGFLNCTAAGPPKSEAQVSEFLRGAMGVAVHGDLPSWLSYQALLWGLALAMGLGKGGFPGMSTSSVAFNALYAPDGCMDLATSLQVPVTTLADVAVVINYFSSARWDIIMRLLPGAGLGIALGSQLVGTLSSSQAKLLVGTVLSLILALGLWQELPKSGKDKDEKKDETPAWATTNWYAGIIGVVGGFASILTNNMGPMLNVYLLTQKLEPTVFVGTRATFFTTVNLVKLAQRIAAGTLTMDLISVGLKMGLASVAGVFIAKLFLKRVSKTVFNVLQYLALAYSSAKLLYSGLAT